MGWYWLKFFMSWYRKLLWMDNSGYREILDELVLQDSGMVGTSKYWMG